MAQRRRMRAEMFSIVHDGQLTQAEALQALRKAAESATEALPSALAQCKTIDDRAKVMTDRDTVVFAYLDSLKKTLIHTAASFERMAADLEREAENVRSKSATLINVSEAINLFADLVRLASSLALAFA
jgi:hypothetical protein